MALGKGLPGQLWFRCCGSGYSRSCVSLHPPSPWLPPAEPAASLVSPDCCWTPPSGFCWWQGKRAAHPLPLPSEAPLERVTLCPLLGVSLSEAEGIRQQSTRTRLPRDDQVGLRQWRSLHRGVWGLHPALQIPLTHLFPLVPLSPESSTTARGTVAPALRPAAARSSPPPTRRMCDSFTKVGRPHPASTSLFQPHSPGRWGAWACLEDRFL